MGHLNARESSYYPPRARWHTQLAFNVRKVVRGRLHLEKVPLPGSLSFPQVILCLLPAYAFFALGRRLLGWVFLSCYSLAVLVFVAALGFDWGNIAYGLMISMHATSIGLLEGVWLKDSGIGTKMGATLCTVVAVWGLFYRPVVNYAEKHWLMPVRVGERVLVINRTAGPDSLKRGDWVAYEISRRTAVRASEGAVYLSAGLGVDRVLALPGDKLRFTREGLAVGDRLWPLGPYMPAEGEIVVPEKVWFIWPSLAISVRGVAPGNITAALQQVAMLSPEQIIGKPFKTWVGRRQTLP